MNKSLFSGHFLQERLPALPEWAEGPAPVYAALLPLWEKAQRLGDHWNEAQTEREFIQPVLALLGWSYTVQAKSNRGGQISRPDYALFVDGAAKEAATPFQGQDDAFFGRVAAVGEAKQWQRPLSQSGQGSGAAWKADRNPSHQMVGYLVGSRVEWGILTNGREWRLYSREVSSVASEFYTVDLADIFVGADLRVRPSDVRPSDVRPSDVRPSDVRPSDVRPSDVRPSDVRPSDVRPSDVRPSDVRPQDGQAQGPVPTPEQLDAFRRWWLFFRRDAFVADAQGQNFVERIHSGSATYARQISDKLKEIVFEEVMPAIAGGFVAFRHNEKGIPAESEADLRAIYAASLSLLYKLLFLLYGEARALLPMENDGYRYESLSAMARRFAGWRDAQRPISGATHATGEYDRLRALFHRIDRGDPSLAIPRYNGGLFDPHKPDNAFLESHKLSDRAVAEAVDLLVRDRGEAVDYAYIDVRNLGAIYEGLLENRLRVIDAGAGRVELVNDKGERKASGSYYTPDYIVKYIVEQTLEPILDERAGVFAGAMERVADVRRRLQSREGETANRLLQREREKWERAAQEAFLGITVCDPAMGSGHFLVNAVDYLTDGIIERMERWRDAHPETPAEWNPLHRLIGDVRQQIVEGMAAQAIPIDPARLDDTALLTRLVMKRCIYGVDLNGMAVELAKLSLWLHSFTVGAPLSFLDHHLRWGNSLIGADVRTVEGEIQRSGQGGQLGLFSGPFAGLLDLTEMMLRIAGRTDSTLADVRRSAAEFDDFESNLLPYKRVLDLWVSQYFGNGAALEFLTLYGGEVLPSLRDGRAVSPQYAAAIEQARELWQEKRFFHWDLEFPEVFVDLERRDWKENPGFDAVIGNPPYVSNWELTSSNSQLPSQLEAMYSEVAYGHWDLFVLFGYRALTLTRANSGRHSFIVPSSLSTEKYGLKFREFVLRKNELAILVDFGEHLVFDQVARQYLIYVAIPRENSNSTTRVIRYSPAEGFVESSRIQQASFLDLSNYSLRVDLNAHDINLKAKIELQSISFGSLCCVNVGVVAHSRSGSPLKFKKNDVLSYQSGQGWKKFVDGGDIGRYDVNWAGLFLDYDSKRDFFHRPKFRELFESPKLMIRRVSGANNALLSCLDDSAYYTNDNVIHAILWTPEIQQLQSSGDYDLAENVGDLALSFLAASINSRLISYYFSRFLATDTLQSSYTGVYPEDVRKLPIRHIDFTTPADERAQAGAAARSLYAAASPAGPLSADGEGESVDDLLAFVDDCLATRNSQLAIRTDVVHDLLAFLAEQMIELNKAKQSEMAGFLSWLEREMGGRVDDLNGKTTIQNYLGDYQKDQSPAPLTDLLDVLRKNRRKLRADPSSRAFQEALDREYTASLDKLLPLKARLAFTDRLIDRIVYRLYGLTEEEIGIVEGRGQG